MAEFKITKKALKKLGFEQCPLVKDWGLEIGSHVEGDFQDSRVYIEVSPERKIVSLFHFRDSAEGDGYNLWLHSVTTDKRLKKLVKLLTTELPF